jgi:hypothetical protein
MTKLVLTIDDDLRERLATLAARNRKPLPEWAAEQLGHLAADPAAEPSSAYSPRWMAAFGSITDPSFEPPARPLPSAVDALDAT